MKRSLRKGEPALTGFDERRSRLVQLIADALLGAGSAEIPLRELAAKIGTSDRMLLYYFTDKADLVQSCLHEISARLAHALAGVLPSAVPPGKILDRVLPLLASKELSPYMAVWADLSARGSRGEEPFRTLARGSVKGWLEWLQQRLPMHGVAVRRDMAAAILTVLEGARLLETFVPGSTQGATKILSRAMEPAA